MRFQHLKEALDEILPKESRQSAVPRIGKPSNPSVNCDRVEGGWPVRQPIDRQAAIVTSRASWIHRPPSNEPPNHMSKVPDSTVPSGRVDSRGEQLYSRDEMIQYLELAVDRKIKSLTTVEQVALAAQQPIYKGKLALEEAMADLDSASARYINSVRQSRVGIVTEVNAMMSSLRDVRQFFVGADHTAEITRLREFVDLCERIQKLKSDGTLDAVCETIIKLA